MKLKYLSSVVSPSDEISYAGALVFSPNGKKLAMGTADRHVLLFDDKLRRRDKFATKPVEAKFGKSSYALKCAVFSPDSTKLAIGQTDHIVFVYRLGDSWEEKKVICNKFGQSSAVAALIWPSESKMVIGLMDGKVRCASVSSNKCATLYRTDTAAVALAQHPNRKSFLSGHADGTIFLYSFETRTHSRVCVHSCAPQALLLSGVGILVAGTDRRIYVYTENGRLLQQFDYGRTDNGEKEFTVASLDASGHNAVLGSFNRVRLMCWNQRRGAWDEGSTLNVHNLYTVSALAWKPDGSTLCATNVLGAMIAVDCAMRKTMLRNRFEVTFVSPSQAIIKDLKGTTEGEEERAGNGECVLRSKRGHELSDIRVMGKEQRYAVAYTAATLILADMHSGLSSEIVWQSGGNEKFFLDNDSVAYIVNAGEISFVGYGRDELAGWIRTERANPHLISVRLRHTDRKRVAAEGDTTIRRAAYLLDARTVSIVNLATNGQIIAQVTHGTAIDWLELNEKANKLLFRDVRAALHLYSLEKGSTTHLIGHCSYVQWVPQSDVVVAQSNEHVCVWYNTDENTERVVQFAVQGEVEMVVRDATRTEVVVIENNNRVAYELDSVMIEFGTALEELDLGRAVLFLEQSEQRGMDVQAMWRKLAQVALQHSQLMVVQRCYASLNDLVRVQFLQETRFRAERQHGGPMDDGALAEHFEVRARLAQMNKQFKLAERIYLEQNLVDEAVNMWRKMGDWEQALELARAINHPELEALRTQHTRYLRETRQQEKEAELKAREGDTEAALELFMAANQPAQAAQLLLDNRQLLANASMVEEEGDAAGNGGSLLHRVTRELMRHELFDKAGELFEAVEQLERAMDCYQQGNLFGKAIQIARAQFPEKVVRLEELWAEWLFAQGSFDVAVPHFLESGNSLRAVDSAIRAKEWGTALEVLRVLEPSDGTAPFYGRIAQNFELEGELDKAERLYVDAGRVGDAVEMYNSKGRWADAYKLAAEFFGEEASRELYLGKAQELEQNKQFAEAEQLLIALGSPNHAIAMYKRAERTEDMMRLMARFHADEVQNAHRRLAEELEAKGDLHAAEEQFLLAKDWAAAVDMYQQSEQWADAHRVARAEGGERAHKQVAYAWAKSLGGDAAVKLLSRHEMLEEAIGMAVSKADFDFAFQLCRLGASSRLPFVQQKFAEQLEDEGELERAEEMYLKAGKAREAVLMHMHAQKWEDAERVAQQHAPEQLPELFIQRARAALEQRDFARAESFLLRANRPDIILAFYRESALWPEALRIARDYVPDELEQCQNDYEEFQLRSGAKGAQSLVAQAKEWERQNEYRRAVECWMRVDGASSDQQLVAQSLAKAAELAVKFLADTDDGVDILGRIAQRQMELRQFLAAGETFLLANRARESIEALVEAHEWAKAKRVAEELAPDQVQLVEDAYRQFLRSHGRVGELADVDVVGAIDMLVEAGQWEKALLTAREQNHRPLLDKYLAVYVRDLLSQTGNVGRALDALRKFGVSAHPQLLRVCTALVETVVNAREQEFTVLAALRDVLAEVSEQIAQRGAEARAETKLFSRHLYLAHFCALRQALDSLDAQTKTGSELNTLRLRVNIAMLRYIEPLRADKAFYEAGNACRMFGGADFENMAFVLLSHCLDVMDAIEENDPNLVDNSLFEGTDVPTSYALPQEKYLSSAEHEEVKEWVLAASVGQTVERTLRSDERGCYEASTVDAEGNQYAVCVVSGYPVIDEGHDFGDGKVADQWAWAAFSALAKGTSSDELYDVQQFIANWRSAS